MNEINYKQFNEKILEVIKREPIEFYLGISTRYTVHPDYAVMTFPSGWTRKIEFKYKIVNPYAGAAHYAFALDKVTLHTFMSAYEINTNEIKNRFALLSRIEELNKRHEKNALEKAEHISLRFNRMVNKIISKL